MLHKLISKCENVHAINCTSLFSFVTLEPIACERDNLLDPFTMHV